MYLKSKHKLDYEKVSTEEWTTGIIEEVQYKLQRNTGYKDPKTGKDIIQDCVRFKFKLEGYKFPHYSSWLTMSANEKANLFIKFLSPLVENAQPEMEFDLDVFKGLPVKIMWVNKGDFQNIELIRPLKAKVRLDATQEEPVEDLVGVMEEAEPF